MIGVDAARRLILEACRPLPAETLAPEQALQRVLAQDVMSAADLPPFDNAAMDGFALRAGAAGLPAGSELAVQGEQAAGDGLRLVLSGACAIMTGAVMPAGCDAVVPVEQVAVLQHDSDGSPRRIRLNAAVTRGQHLRRRGEDVERGQRVLRAGQYLGAGQLLLLAGLGVGAVRVARRPRFALLCTGRELVDDAAQALAPGQIRNANGPYLAARLRAAGAKLVHVASVPDDAPAFRAALDQALAAGAEVVLSTGAVSMGRYDFVPPLLAQLGAELRFHKVAMRPGKPLLFARLAQGPLFFGLPGNPVSSAVGLRFFVEPALRALLGMSPEPPWRLPLAAAVTKKSGFTLFQKAVLRNGDDGAVRVALLPGQESFKTRPLAEATVWAVLPAAAEALGAGDCIEVFPLGHEAGDPFHGGMT